MQGLHAFEPSTWTVIDLESFIPEGHLLMEVGANPSLSECNCSESETAGEGFLFFAACMVVTPKNDRYPLSPYPQNVSFFNIHEEAVVKLIARRIRDLQTSIRHLRLRRTATNLISTAPIHAHGVACRQLKNRDAVVGSRYLLV